MKIFPPHKSWLWVLFVLSWSCSENLPDPDVENPGSKEPPIPESLLMSLDSTTVSVTLEAQAIHDALSKVMEGREHNSIVGMGEATHGTSEFFVIKAEIFKYLVRERGCRSLLFEMDFAEALIFNDYIQWKKGGDLAGIMKEKMIFWMWKSEEVLDLMEWMRNFNAGRDREDMIGFYGLDVQFSTYDADMVIEVFSRFDQETADYLSTILLPYKNIQAYYADGASLSEQSVIETGIRFANDIIRSAEEEITAHSSSMEFNLLSRLGIKMDQTAFVRLQRAMNRTNTNRDKYMAENALWFRDLLGSGHPLVIWGHNAHIAADPGYIGGGSMGHFLEQSLKNRYMPVGFGFSKGSFHATNAEDGIREFLIDIEPVHYSINDLFHRGKKSNFMLDLDALNPELRDWLSESRTFLNIGTVFNDRIEDYYQPVSILSQFDVIIYVDMTSKSILL